jgi:hypothetical protein
MGVWERLGDVEQMARLLLHPAHQGVAARVGELISEYRDAQTREELRAVQEHLAGALVEAERRYGEARRREKRKAGDPMNTVFWRFACVRLRAVGDAVAWRFLGFRRQWILLMGRNQHPGPVTTKAGFADEWQKFQEHWEDGEPTLLTALTNCITFGDLLVARGEVLWTIEVKRDARHFKRAQTEKLARLQVQLMGEPRIDADEGPSWILESSVPLHTFWPDAQSHIERALVSGFASWVPSPGVEILFTSLAAAAMVGRHAAEATFARERESAQAQLGPASHSILIHSYHFPYRSNRTAPFAIFPIRPEYAAMVLTGELVFVVELRIERLLQELRRVGFDARHLMPADTQSGPLPSDIIEWRGRNGRGTLHASAIEQLGVELVDPTAWADGMAGSLIPPAGEPRWGSFMCLAREGDVWR